MEQYPEDQTKRKVRESLYILSELAQRLKLTSDDYYLAHVNESKVVFIVVSYLAHNFPIDMFSKTIEDLVYQYKPIKKITDVIYHYNKDLKRYQVSTIIILTYLEESP